MASSARSVGRGRSDDDQPRLVEPGSTTREPAEAARSNRDRRPALDDEEVIRTAAQFTATLNRLGRQGGTLRFAAGADLDLPAISIDGRHAISSSPCREPERPRLRFRAVEDLRRGSADWTVMLSLRSGSLHLQGIDVVVPDQEMLQTDRLAIAGLMPGTELTSHRLHADPGGQSPGGRALRRSTARRSAKYSIGRGSIGPNAVIRVRDSLLRPAAKGPPSPHGRKVDIQLTNVLVSTEGSLVHAVGEVRSGRADSPSVKVRLDQVTALVKGGLVHLDATKNLDEPELPFAAIEADSSILSTANRDIPLLRLDGKDETEDFTDRIHWAGRKVAYDRIQTYRRDEVHQNGVPPKIYNRANWSTAFLPTDESPILGDVKFLPRNRPIPGRLEDRPRRLQTRSRQPDGRNRAQSRPHSAGTGRTDEAKATLPLSPTSRAAIYPNGGFSFGSISVVRRVREQASVLFSAL